MSRGDSLFASGFGVLAARDREPAGCMDAGHGRRLLARVAFLLLGVAALVLGVGFLLDRWTLVGVPFLLFGVALLLGGVAPLLAGWTLVGVALLLGPVTTLLLGVGFLLDRWTWLGSRSCWGRSRPRSAVSRPCWPDGS